MTFKQVFISAIALVVIPGCIKNKDNFFQEINQHKIIALQPLDEYDNEQLVFISDELRKFYNRSVVILKPVPVPPTYRLAPGIELYSADSILNMLSTLLTGEVIEVIGLTNKNMFVFKKNEDKTARGPSQENVSVVMGFGDYPGNCSVVSDYIFKTRDTKLLRHRLRSVIIHEIGHNLGLDHCAVKNCLMSEENSEIAVLDNSGNDYCDRCKRKLNH